MDYLLLSRPIYSITSELKFITRNMDASDLTGFAGSQVITGTAVNYFDTFGLTLEAKFAIGKKAFVNIAGGLCQWYLKTTAVAYSATGGYGPSLDLAATQKKLIQLVLTRLWVFSFSKSPYNFDLEFYNQSLASKAGTQILVLN